MRDLNIRHYKGKQFRYLMFLCDRRKKKQLMSECLLDLTLPHPKEKDLTWRVRNVETGKWEECDRPLYISDVDHQAIEKMKSPDDRQPKRVRYEQITMFDVI